MPNNMSQSGSRLVRLLLFLLASEEGASRDEVYQGVSGYDNEATRSRIFEQDISCLEASGVQILRKKHWRQVEYKAVLPAAGKV